MVDTDSTECLDFNEGERCLGHPPTPGTAVASPPAQRSTPTACVWHQYGRRLVRFSRFNGAWRVVALHHAAGPTKSPGELDRATKDFNQGIPVRGIVEELKKQLAGKPELAALELE